VSARPRDVLGVANGQQQLEVLGEEVVVVVERITEKRERLDERASARHDLGPAAREQVEGREVLEDTDRIVGAEHGDRAREADRGRSFGRRGEHDSRGGDSELGPVVLADAEHVEADLVGELDLLEQVAQPLRRRDRPAGCRVGRHFREGVDAQFHRYLRTQVYQRSYL